MADKPHVDNQMYRKVMEDTKDTFCPFRKEYQMEVIESHLKADLAGRRNVRILEAACGQGRLLYYLNQFDPTHVYAGFDYSRDFIQDAVELFKDTDTVTCFYGDLFNLPASMNKQYDITFLYKTLYCIPDYKAALQALLAVTKEKLYITSPLYDGDIDFEIKMKVHQQYKGEGDYSTYYIYSRQRVAACLQELGVKSFVFHDLSLPIDLPKPTNLDVLQTYTIRTAEGDNIELTNIIKLDWKLIEVTL